MRLDTIYTVNTPEGIALQLTPAGPVPRFLAWIVDLLLRTGIVLVLLIGLSLALGNTGRGIALIFAFFLEWFYPVYFELRKQGQTPGKKMMNLYVAHTDASPVSTSASIIRNLLRAVDFLPLMYGFGLASMLLNKRFQRLGDLAANTVVLYKPEPIRLVSQLEVDAIRPSTPLTLAEHQAIMLFAQRKQSLTPERLEELAQLTGPLVTQQTPATPYLLSIAQWLMGGKR
ncbi:MAG: RDD family protein [Thiotrichaceae bacterium]